MSEHFRIEQDGALRALVLTRNDTPAEFYIPLKMWDEFVAFVEDVAAKRRLGRKAVKGK